MRKALFFRLYEATPICASILPECWSGVIDTCANTRRVESLNYVKDDFMMDNPTDFVRKLLDESKTKNSKSYEYRIEALKAAGKETFHIESTVQRAISNLEADKRSFVIYGEPQSGKTEMMIALTAKLLDRGFRLVIILMNDSLALLHQNLTRFKKAGLRTIPVNYRELLDQAADMESKPRVVFSKKNASDLRKLIELVRKTQDAVVIDDEADYATPNSKVNKEDVSTINDLTGQLVGVGYYIGVTATPARLDLNHTHLNEAGCWVDFTPHSNYTGQNIFFPTLIAETKKFTLTLLPDDNDDPKYLRRALFSFLVNSAYLNLTRGPRSYTMLVHTSGKKEDHHHDSEDVNNLLKTLMDDGNLRQAKLFEEIFKLAEAKYSSEAPKIVEYIMDRIESAYPIVMNSDHASDITVAEDPPSPFTIVIGGNSISRGVTFGNLLSMFFTRDAKHKIQQDTYIQRARMFGSRGDILQYFELSIPRRLYADWRRAFIFHRLSLESRKNGNGIPVWHEGMRVKVAANSSIDMSRVTFDRGEMGFPKFNYSQDVLDIFRDSTVSDFDKLVKLGEIIPPDSLPRYLIDFIHSFSGYDEKSLVIHRPRSIMEMREGVRGYVDYEDISRSRGLTGGGDLRNKFKPEASHHIFIFTNDRNEARIIYKFNENVSFIKGKS